MITSSKRMYLADKIEYQTRISDALYHFHKFGNCTPIGQIVAEIPSEKNKVRLAYWLIYDLFFQFKVKGHGIHINISKSKRKQATQFRGAEFQIDSFGNWFDKNVPTSEEEGIQLALGLRKSKKWKKGARARVVSGGLPSLGRR